MIIYTTLSEKRPINVAIHSFRRACIDRNQIPKAVYAIKMKVRGMKDHKVVSRRSKMAAKYLVTSIFCFSICFILLRSTVPFVSSVGDQWSLSWITSSCVMGLLTLTSFLLGTVYLMTSTHSISKYHTISSAPVLLVVRYILIYIGKRQLSSLRRSCLDARRTQEERIKLIMSKNKDTDYGRKFNLKDIHSLEDLQTKHPLTTYDHYKPFVQRVAKGETNVMTVEKITRLNLTSGTTGEGKQIPFDIRYLVNLFAMIQRLQFEHFPNASLLQKEFRIHCNSKISISDGGIPIAAAGVVDRNNNFLLNMYSTPPEGFFLEDIKEAFYVHFLFALRDRELEFMFAVFTSTVADGFKYLEEHWPEMVDDIKNGTVNSKLNLPPSIREALTRAMGSGESERAEEIRRQCKAGQDGIIKRLWPNMQCILAIDNVGIRENILKTIGKGLVLFPFVYGSSESIIGLNLTPLEQQVDEYLLYIKDTVFEFIDENDISEENPKTYLIDEIEVGRNYEVVISQIWGLYRYRFGDVIQVTGFYQNCPKVKVLYRTATLLNLFGEKVDQVVISQSLSAALRNWPEVTMKHYSVAESTLISPMLSEKDDTRPGGFYIFFLELEVRNSDDSLERFDADIFGEQLEENMYSRHEFFRTFRDTKQISPCKVYVVKTGTFEKLKKFVLDNTSASVVQFKMPQKLRTPAMGKVMLDNLV